MTEDHLVSLIVRQLSGKLDPAEVQELEEWVEHAPANRQLLMRVSDEALLESEINQWKQIDPAKGYAKWVAYQHNRRRTRIIGITGWSVAASLLIVALIVGLIKQSGPATPPTVIAKRMENPVLPGRNTATLTLANGQQIFLDSAGKGEIAMQGNTRLVKPDSGRLSYLATGGGNAATVTYNILTTPKAGQYQLMLADGSRVWLNNVSSLRFPTAFEGKERVVELSGEGYFEIANNPEKPFIVKVGGQSVEVLGTSFNIMAYPEEGGMQATLLTGAVRVRSENNTVQLKPDEQARVNANGSLSVLQHVDAADVVSWKNGFFYFGRASLAAVMRQIARWYNIDVVYEGKAPDLEFGGKIDRGLKLDELLQYLDRSQVHFRLEGRKLIVLSK